MTYPNDDQFEDTTIAGVRDCKDGGYEITRGDDGWCFFVPSETPIKPRTGLSIRLYGQPHGRFRGMFIEGQEVFYRTEAEDKVHYANELYGKDAADLLDRWNNGRSVFSIEMGGLGPGYEQCIQVTAFEILRYLLTEKPDPSLWEEADIWKQWRDKIQDHAFANDTINNLGLSGAQYGAAVSLATSFYMHGPQETLKQVKDERKIQVSKSFPGDAR